MLKAGEKAPSVTLESDKGDKVSLGALGPGPVAGQPALLLNGQPLFQHGGYCMHGIIECWRESTGQDQTDLATYIGKVANFLYKGDQRLGNVGPDSPLLANGVPHPNDATKYAPATYFPFSFKRGFAGALTAAVNNNQVTIPVDDTSTFLLANNGNYGNNDDCNDINVEPCAKSVYAQIGSPSDTLSPAAGSCAMSSRGPS